MRDTFREIIAPTDPAIKGDLLSREKLQDLLINQNVAHMRSLIKRHETNATKLIECIEQGLNPEDRSKVAQRVLWEAVHISKRLDHSCVLMREVELIDLIERLDNASLHILEAVHEGFLKGMTLEPESLMAMGKLTLDIPLNSQKDPDICLQTLSVILSGFKDNPTPVSGGAVVLATNSLSNALSSNDLSVADFQSLISTACKTEEHYFQLRRGLDVVSKFRPHASKIVTRPLKELIRNKLNEFFNQKPEEDILTEAGPDLLSTPDCSIQEALSDTNAPFISPALVMLRSVLATEQPSAVNLGAKLDLCYRDSSLTDLSSDERAVLIEKTRTALLQHKTISVAEGNIEEPVIDRWVLSPDDAARLLLGISAIATRQEFEEIRSLVDPNIAVLSFNPLAIKLLSIAYANQGIDIPFSKQVLDATANLAKLRRAPDGIELPTAILLKSFGIKSDCGGFVAPFEVDLRIPDHNLVIEFSGVKYHANQSLVDGIRTRILENQGFNVINYSVQGHIDIPEFIRHVLKDLSDILGTKDGNHFQFSVSDEEMQYAIERSEEIRKFSQVRNITLSKLEVRRIRMQRARHEKARLAAAEDGDPTQAA